MDFSEAAGGGHRAEVHVRWSDFDRFGHLNNAAYIELAQEARNIFAIEEFIGRGLDVPAVFVRSLDVEYLKPILPDTTTVEVITTVSHVGTTSFTTTQRILDRDGRECCVVRCVQIAVDLTTSSPRSITTSELKVLDKARVDPSGQVATRQETTGPNTRKD